ncbi:MAG: hypothetical protein WA101_01975 [Minisyncoccia bacterium]
MALKSNIQTKIPILQILEASNSYNELKIQDLSQKSQEVGSKKYFASNRGQKYYSIGCSAGKTIKQENRIYFSTPSEAEQAGYTISSSCN